jgi:Zn-dependent peptidase ImmA (M78 family)/DNA-binding XRE family transcriptional regulator
MITGERIRQARELRGLTQTELARRLGVSQPAIAYAEAGRSQPSAELLEGIALQTGFPLSFFRQPAAPDFPAGSLLFRRRASMTSQQATKVRRYAQTALELVAHMDRRLQGPELRLPRLDEDPVAAAQLTRSALGFSPDTPIPNLVNTLERNGVFVLALPFPIEGGDAFSAWIGDGIQRPVIVLAGEAPGDRRRFSTAHEVKHLVMDRAPNAPLATLEADADRFASELLLPGAAMREVITPPVTLTSLAPLKRLWGVSIQALIRRARDLDIISERQYRYLFEQVAARGWRTREPEALDIPVEKPRAVRKMAELLYGNPIDYQHLAADTRLSTAQVRQIVDAHASVNELVRSTADQPQTRDNVRQLPFRSLRPRESKDRR